MLPQKLLAFAVIFALVFGFPASYGVEEADGWILDKFSGNKNETTITFLAGGGTDDSAKIILPEGVPVYSARLDVSASPDDGGDYPENVWLDVGMDGDYEWMFWGHGYGAMGKQTRFTNNNTGKTVLFDEPGTNSSARFRLPKDAQVDSATVKVQGRTGPNSDILDYHRVLQRFAD